MNSAWGWSNQSSINWTSGTSAVIYPTAITGTSVVALPGVMESPAGELGDREWLDAQIDEVCALA